MLIIQRRFSHKPKYVPITKLEVWVVSDTKTNEIVFGPKELRACHRFMKEQEGVEYD